jgi:molybdopterin-guanine dinucleotide biosynthesis protein A
MSKAEICILAGGLSSRMKRNKARLRLGGKTLLRHVYDVANRTEWPVRIIRRDLVPRCGPLGGIYTAFKTTQASRVLFLACDMPFVTFDLLQRLLQSESAAFASSEEKAGFPFILPCDVNETVERQLVARQYSLQALARVCGAALLPASSAEVFNVNTPDEMRQAEQIVHRLNAAENI